MVPDEALSIDSVLDPVTIDWCSGLAIPHLRSVVCRPRIGYELGGLLYGPFCLAGKPDDERPERQNPMFVEKSDSLSILLRCRRLIHVLQDFRRAGFDSQKDPF